MKKNKKRRTKPLTQEARKGRNLSKAEEGNTEIKAESNELMS